MPRSAWGLSTPTDDPSPRCADPDVNPDWWSADSWSDRGLAVHECVRHCPVRAWCTRDLELHPRRVGGTVRNGVFYVTTKLGPQPSAGQPDEVLCGSCERKRRYAAAKELVEAVLGG